jgi:hypothetical protein
VSRSGVLASPSIELQPVSATPISLFGTATMTASGTAAVPANDPPRVGSAWLAIPSWLISLLFHGGVLALFAVTFQQIGRASCRERV